MERSYHTIGRVVGYHGCDLDVATKLLTHELDIAPSENEYDWLGRGAYFGLTVRGAELSGQSRNPNGAK
jgi:hypothetical protein